MTWYNLTFRSAVYESLIGFLIILLACLITSRMDFYWSFTQLPLYTMLCVVVDNIADLHAMTSLRKYITTVLMAVYYAIRYIPNNSAHRIRKHTSQNKTRQYLKSKYKLYIEIIDHIKYQLYSISVDKLTLTTWLFVIRLIYITVINIFISLVTNLHIMIFNYKYIPIIRTKRLVKIWHLLVKTYTLFLLISNIIIHVR